MQGKFVKSLEVYDGGWFKENEDLGDIIKQHRLNTTLITSMEKTLKANKQKLVALDNEVQSLRTKLSTLAASVRKPR